MKTKTHKSIVLTTNKVSNKQTRFSSTANTKPTTNLTLLLSLRHLVQ